MRNALSLWRNRNPFNDFLSLQRELERAFEPDWTARMPETTLGKDWNPKAAVTEDETAYHLRVDLPGVNKDLVKLDFNDGYLTVSGERREERKDDKEKEHYSEVFYGSFTRTFHFPQTVDEEKIAAKFENGVLTIDLAKASKSRVRQIAIK